MGVPALFRWLSKKYPKIVLPVVEDEEVTVKDEDGKDVEVPIDISKPNPNGVEFDNLYLDMNGIVHPCTHPEGKPAPETEEEMMVEIFKYTERIVNMIRPRKLLFMAIDGVAPRAKMNQQRSRRFRAAMDAKIKEDQIQEGIAMFEAHGQTVSDDIKRKAWDSNAITPGTPFMDLLAASLRYWVVMKLNTDRGWSNLEVIISDASVPGEGEHKIMDFIRRQRVQSSHDPNTQHVIYGLDADLIMLSLATHEPNFQVLREDVFAQEGSSTACRTCGQEGHYSASCPYKNQPLPVVAPDLSKPLTPADKKPFIFLSVPILREYLEVELQLPYQPFAFDLERAIDDWVLLIFFVGNDFLPHLPSLEIREGAIDVLLKIWKAELPMMGGYICKHGTLELERVGRILDGLAGREDEIFRRRKETEDRQDQNAKRRRIEQAARATVPPSVQPASSSRPSTPGSGAPPTFHPLPSKPSFDSFGTSTPATNNFIEEGSKALGGSNHDVVANRRAIRMANMSAAEALRAELTGLAPVKPTPRVEEEDPPFMAPTDRANDAPVPMPTKNGNIMPTAKLPAKPIAAMPSDFDLDSIPGLDTVDDTPPSAPPAPAPTIAPPPDTTPPVIIEETSDSAQPPQSDVPMDTDSNSPAPHGVKRKLEELDTPQADSDVDSGIVKVEEDDDGDAPPEVKVVSKVEDEEQKKEEVVEDNVKLWEPGYRDRYYQAKFGVELTDVEFRQKVTKSYVEGLAWVLHYYYQGTPSWQWYYPYHFAPFAADFMDVAQMDIQFDLGKPFKPFEQLMGVFPAASRVHLPKPFQALMTEATSPIIDFYPETFEIDMNGKKMSWQGVALLPFIDEERLLDAMKAVYDQLDEDEKRRNSWGSSTIFVGEQHTLYPFVEGLYVKRKSADPLPLDTKLSAGLAGSVLPDPQCIPGATFYCPLDPAKLNTSKELSDIFDDRSISALYYFPRQTTPHRAVLLNGVRKPTRVLTAMDQQGVRRGPNRGGRGNGPGGGGGGRNGGPGDWGMHSMHREMGGGRGYGDYSHNNYGNGQYGGGGIYDYQNQNQRRSQNELPTNFSGRANAYGYRGGYENYRNPGGRGRG